MTTATEPKPMVVNVWIGARLEEIELPEGATNGDVIHELGDHLSIHSNQENISDIPDAPVEPGQVFTAQPAQPKQG